MADSSEIEHVYVPLPPPATKLTEDPHAKLSETEQQQYDEVLAHFSKEDYKLPGLEADAALEDREKFWLSRECLLRFLRASKWKTNAAIQRLEATLKWRREYGIYNVVTASHVEPEAVTGKEILFGYDANNRPGFYMFPSRQNTNDPTRQIQFVVWMLERAVDLMGPGVETLDLLINYGDKEKNPSMSVAMTFLNTLQDHYPERLGLALILNVPFLLNVFYKMITPFIDPVTRTKMMFNPQVVKDNIFAPDQVMSLWWGGNQNFEYEHEKYWPAVVQLTESRSKAYFEKWKELGGTIGIKEWDYKGGSSVAPVDGPQNGSATSN